MGPSSLPLLENMGGILLFLLAKWTFIYCFWRFLYSICFTNLQWVRYSTQKLNFYVILLL